MFKFVLLLLFGLVSSSPAYADSKLNSLFQEIEKTTKGPFGLNYLQGTRSRGSVRDGGRYSGKFQFQAAFRNAKAKELAEKHGFYTGNLFTTNYYQLMGEYVYGDANASFELDHEGLLAKADLAMADASQMVPHWVLEKYYIKNNPNSGIARGFAKRGISDVLNESEYASYFLNFYLSSLQDPYQYLPAFLLATQSPIIESSALPEARDLVAKTYDRFVKIYGTSDRRTKGLYQIRNAVHNQLSERVIGMIDDYLSTHSKIESKGKEELKRIRAILVDYYNRSPKQIRKLADAVGMNKVSDAANTLSNKGSTESALLALSEAVAYYRSELTNDAVIPFNKKAQALAVIASTTQFLNKEVFKLGGLNSADTGLVLLNSIYAEGYLIQDNWQYFHEEISRAKGAELSLLLTEVIDVSSMTLEEALGQELSQWQSVTKSGAMDNFIDDVLKGSALNSAALMVSQ